MFGGGDTQNFVPTTLFKIFELFPQAAVNLVQGKHSKSLKESFSLSECNDRLKVEVQPDINKLLMMMMKSDLAISAAGQTLQELARLGIPTVGVQIAENQKNNILGWASLGAVIPVMNFEVEDFKFALTRAINSLRSKSQRQKISVRASNLVDGQGARRIASFVSKMYRYRNSPCI